VEVEWNGSGMELEWNWNGMELEWNGIHYIDAYGRWGFRVVGGV
jgi:hypothetical protein